MKEKRARGGQSKFTPAVSAEICERLAKGEPLAAMCRDAHMPDASTVWDWTKLDDAFAQAIARAREAGFDALAAECLDIAEDGSRDYVTKENDNGTTYEQFNSEHVQRSKLRIETRLKLLAKWDPKRYGDKQQVEHSGGVQIVAGAHDEAL